MGNLDVHCCGDCMTQFKNLEDFFVHKLEIEKCSLTLEDSGLVPGLKVPVFLKIDNSSGNKCFLRETSKAEPFVEEVEVYDVAELSEEEMVVDSPTEALKIDEHLPSPQVNVNEIENKEVAEDDREDNEANKEEDSSAVKCPICDHRYKNKTILKVHKHTVHSPDRPYSCSICSLAFKTKGSLTRHKRRHTDERPYKCIACGKSFRESGSLTRHLKSILPCNSFHKTLIKESKEAMKTQKTKPSSLPRPTSVNVLITRVLAKKGDKESLGDKVIATAVVNELGDKVEHKVVEIKLKQSAIQSGEGKLVISESDSE